MSQNSNTPLRSDAKPAKLRLPHIRAAWWGILSLAIITLIATTTQSSHTMYVYDSVLLACIGAIGLQLLTGTAGQISIGAAAFLLLGAFASVFMLRSGVPFPLDIVCATAISGVAGLIVGLPALRLSALFLALATLAAYFIADSLGNLYQQRVPSAEASGFYLPQLFSSKGVQGEQEYWAWLLLIVVAVVILGASRIMREKSGRAMRLMREHELIAPTLGISVSKYKLWLFMLSSMAFGFEGSLFAHFSGNVVTGDFTLTLAFQFVAMIVIGGLDSIAGAVIGAAIVIGLPGMVPQAVQSVVGGSVGATDGANIALILYGVLLIIFVTASHNGVVGFLRDLGRRCVARFFGADGRFSLLPSVFGSQSSSVPFHNMSPEENIR